METAYLRGSTVLGKGLRAVIVLYARQQNVSRVLATVEVSVCPSVRHTLRLY